MTDTITRTNPFSGVTVELTMEEAVRYDQIKQDEVNENYGRMHVPQQRDVASTRMDPGLLQAFKQNPYTQSLISSLPRRRNRGEFQGIPGMAPSLYHLPDGCKFHPRCSKQTDRCTK